MNKKLLASIVVLGLCCGATALAQEQKSGLMGWLKSIQKKIDQVKPKKTLSTSNAVAGIRGAKQDSQVKLYWKGKKGDEIVTDEELGKFKACVELGDKDPAAMIKELEAFMKQYPDSPLIPDVKKTLDLARAEPQEVKKEEKQEAVKEEKKEEPKQAEKQDDKKDEKKEAVKEEKKD